MPEQIFLEGGKRAILLGACQIYSSYIQKDCIKSTEDEDKYLTKAGLTAIRLARLIDSETCLNNEICDDKNLWPKK